MASSSLRTFFPDPSPATADEVSEPPASSTIHARARTLGIPAVVEWTEDDGQSCRTCYLGYSTTNPVHLVFELDPSTTKSAVSFSLSIVVALRKQGTRPFRAKEALRLLSRPNCLSRLSVDASSQTPSPPPPPPPLDDFCRQLPQVQGAKLVRLSAELGSPADLIAPDWPLTPQNRDHGDVLESVRRLACQSIFSVYVQQQEQQQEDEQAEGLVSAVPMDDLRSFCASVSNREVRPNSTSRDLGHFYRGRRAKVISADLLMSMSAAADPKSRSDNTRPRDVVDPNPSPTHGPPAYHDLDPPPPPPFLDGGGGGGSGDARGKKRRRASSSPSLDPGSGSGSGAVTKGASVNDLRAYMEGFSRKVLAEELAPIRERVTQLEQRLTMVEAERDEARDRVQRLEDELAGVEGYIDKRASLEIDDLGTSIREDFDDLERDLRRDVTDLSTSLREGFDELEQEIRHEAAEEAREGIEEEVSRQLATARVHVFNARLELDLDADER